MLKLFSESENLGAENVDRFVNRELEGSLQNSFHIKLFYFKQIPGMFLCNRHRFMAELLIGKIIKFRNPYIFTNIFTLDFFNEIFHMI